VEGNDPDGGAKVNSYLGYLLNRISDLEKVSPPPPSFNVEQASPEAKNALLTAVLQGIKNFIYVKGGN
jgi:hypothetical protein